MCWDLETRTGEVGSTVVELLDATGTRQAVRSVRHGPTGSWHGRFTPEAFHPRLAGDLRSCQRVLLDIEGG